MKWRIVYGATGGYISEVEIEMVIEAHSYDAALLVMERAIRGEPLLSQLHMEWTIKRAAVILGPPV